MGNSCYRFCRTYTETFVNSVGCDSVHIVTIGSVLHNTEGTTTTACDVMVDNTIMYHQIHDKTYQNSVGDSVHTLVLTIVNSNSGTSSETSCEFYVWGGDTLSSSGLYTDTLTNVDGAIVLQH